MLLDAGADGFLGKLLSGVNINSDFDMGMGYSTKTGVYFTGSATLEIQSSPTAIAGDRLIVAIPGAG